MKNWMRRKLRSYLLIDKEDVLKLVRSEAIEVVKTMERGHVYWGHTFEHGKLLKLIDTAIETYSSKILMKNINSHIEALKINQESFLDDIVKRLKDKQV